ncbi:MAG: hypothetical protein KA190_29550, partial [Kofleriaceae bacterium]|nr:hypothetical protein [Kofleriaceae bacterium]
MDQAQCRELLLRWLRQRGVGGAEGVAILDELTTEKAYGWIFYCNSRRFVETGDLLHCLIGQGPNVVMRETGEIVELGSQHPSDEA